MSFFVKDKTKVEKALQVITVCCSVVLLLSIVGGMSPVIPIITFLTLWISFLTYGIYDKLYYTKYGNTDELRITTLNDASSGSLVYYLFGFVILLLGVLSVFKLDIIGIGFIGFFICVLAILLVLNGVFALPSCIVTKTEHTLNFTGLEDKLETNSINSYVIEEERIIISLVGDRKVYVRNLALSTIEQSQLSNFLSLDKVSTNHSK